MSINELCRLDNALVNYDLTNDVNNCPGGSDVYKYVGGKPDFISNATKLSKS